jgi:hypothetical protein
MKRNNVGDFTLNLKHCFARPKMKGVTKQPQERGVAMNKD